MQMLRATDPSVVEFISKNLPDGADYTREDSVEMLREWMIRAPDTIAVFIAVQGEECIAHLIGMCPDRQKHVWVHHAWSKESNNPKVSDALFYRLVMWAHNHGYDKLKMETQRDIEVWQKKWNFYVTSWVMEFDIPEDFEIELLRNHSAITGKKETSDEQRIEAKDHSSKPADGGSKAVGGSDKRDSGKSPADGGLTPAGKPARRPDTRASKSPTTLK